MEDDGWCALSSRQKSAVWDKIGEGNLKNGAMYFEAFARVFFEVAAVMTRPRSNTIL